ncbi:MAG TPA: asparaginase [Casimicrobiaceae bacterium]
MTATDADAGRAPGPAHVPLAEATRGGIVESIHLGSVAVVDRDGTLVAAAGDPEFVTFTRSALKPLQALPFVAAGGVERFGFSQAEVALMCASHSGEPRHVEGVADMLARAGNRPEDLQCGTQVPGFYDATSQFPPPPPYSPLAHNCSGKHAGMLAYCAQCGWDRTRYLDLDHPLQQAIRRAVAALTGVPEAKLQAGIDGCSAPNYAVPLSRLAVAFARLASDRGDGDYGNAPRTIADAMAAHPEMVSGAARSDLALMRAGRGDWVSKIGAEGVQALGVRSLGIGIAVKVIDGQKRGLYPAVVAVLDALGLVDAAARAGLAPWARRDLTNYRGTVTGELRPALALRMPGSRVHASGADGRR